jgi:hypothetical protein
VFGVSSKPHPARAHSAPSASLSPGAVPLVPRLRQNRESSLLRATAAAAQHHRRSARHPYGPANPVHFAARRPRQQGSSYAVRGEHTWPPASEGTSRSRALLPAKGLGQATHVRFRAGGGHDGGGGDWCRSGPAQYRTTSSSWGRKLAQPRPSCCRCCSLLLLLPPHPAISALWPRALTLPLLVCRPPPSPPQLQDDQGSFASPFEPSASQQAPARP